LKRTPVITEYEADPGGIEKAIRTGDAIDEGVHGRAGNFIHWHPGVFQPHRRFENEKVVVTGVVEVDGAALSHH
jgi:hypothetical protein